MKLDLKKPVEITTVIIIYILKNLGRKKLKKEGEQDCREANKKEESKTGHSFKNLLCDEPWARHLHKSPEGYYFINFCFNIEKTRTQIR